MGSVGRMKVVKTLPYSGLQKTQSKLGDLGFNMESAGIWESEVVHKEEEGNQDSSLTLNTSTSLRFDEGDIRMGFKHDP